MIIMFLHLSSVFMVVGELDENITPTLMMVPYGADRRCCLAHPHYILYIMSAELRQKTQPERSWSFIDFIAFISLSRFSVYSLRIGCRRVASVTSDYYQHISDDAHREKEKKIQILETKKEPKRNYRVAIIIIINL